MTTQDLLLTDEEREAFVIFAYDRPTKVDIIRDALIAARAENKRKDEMLAKAEEALIWASGAFQSEEESAAWAAHGRPIVDEMRALLHSEKGGE